MGNTFGLILRAVRFVMVKEEPTTQKTLLIICLTPWLFLSPGEQIFK